MFLELEKQDGGRNNTHFLGLSREVRYESTMVYSGMEIWTWRYCLNYLGIADH